MQPGLAAVLFLLSLACNLEGQSFGQQPVATSTSILAPTPTLNVPQPTETAANLDTGWATLRPGLERRTILYKTSEGEPLESVYILRIDPANFRFDVGYHPGQPQSLIDWQAETGALIVVNGGFFTAEFAATGAIVVNGLASGTSYQDFGGMFTVTAEGPGLRWLPQRPYDPGEGIVAGLQSFPMLIAAGGQLAYTDEDNQRDRRTVIGQDRDGRMLFVLATTGTFSLYQTARFLSESDLNVDQALNLDGGTSTGLVLAEPPESIPAFAWVPAVIVVYPKEGGMGDL